MPAGSDDELQQVVQLTFRQRHEEVLACEAVVVIGRRRPFKTPRPRLLALCRPFSAAAPTGSPTSNATLNVVQVGAEQATNIKLVFGVARLVDIAQEEGFDATFNFGSSGLLSVRFGSYIQRQMFVSAVRSVLRDVQLLTPGATTDHDGVQALLLDEVGAATEHNIVAHVKSQRRVKHRALTTEDEQQLQALLGPHSFDDIRATEKLLSTHQKKAELLSVNDLVISACAWEEVREHISSIMEDVGEMEARIAQYSKCILSQKEQLQRIEHQHNTLQRKQQNLHKLQEQLQVVRGQLNLPPQVTALLQRVGEARSEDLEEFLSNESNVRRLSDAVGLITSLLQNTKLESDYPIALVAARRAFFAEQRRAIAHRTKTYILDAISRHEKLYLTDPRRFSTKNQLIWKMHLEVTNMMTSFQELIKTLRYVDFEGFIAVLRRYRVCMQRVYAREMQNFFKYLRGQLKKVGSHRPFLIGVRDSSDGIVFSGSESTRSETPHRRGSLANSDGLRWTPTCSPLGYPHSFCHMSGSFSRLNISAPTEGQLFVDLPVACDDTLRLYDPIHTQAANVGHNSPTPAPSLLAPTVSRTNGQLKPDVAFAMTLEAAFCMVLQEEDTLRRCFGLVEGREECSKGEENHHDFTPSASDALSNVPESDKAGLLRESLLELFGGDKVVQFYSGALNTAAPSAKHSEKDDVPSARVDVDCDTTTADKNEGKVCTKLEKGQEDAQKGCYLQKELVDLVQYIGERCDRLNALPAMVMIKAYRREGTPTASSSFCQSILQALEPIVASLISQSIMEQTASIKTCVRRYVVDPSGLLSCFSGLPTLVQRLETMHDSLPVAVRTHSEYASVVLTLVDQCFESLNCITNLAKSEANYEVKLSRLECIVRRANRIFNAGGENAKSAEHGFLQQYRHQAFFCLFYESLHPMSNAMELLRERYDSSCALRDRYRELYLTRAVLVKEFPEFGPFTLVAEDLAQVHTPDDLRSHAAFSVSALQLLLTSLPEEIRSGIPASSGRMKKHFLRDVARRKNEVALHCTLLQRAWSDFSAMFLQKFDFLESILQWSMYANLNLDIKRHEVVQLLRAV